MTALLLSMNYHHHKLHLKCGLLLDVNFIKGTLPLITNASRRTRTTARVCTSSKFYTQFTII